MNEKRTIVVCFITFFLGRCPLFAEDIRAEMDRLKQRVEEQEETNDKLEAEIDLLRAQNRLVVERTSASFSDSTYLKVGMSLLVPRKRTFEFETDTGLGALAGVGHYWGRNHVTEATLEWDIFPALALRYRYEFHYSSPLVTFAPVIGVKTRLFERAPFDYFLERPDLVKDTFFIVGAALAMPLNQALMVFQLEYLTNQQSFLVAHIAAHFFL